MIDTKELRRLMLQYEERGEHPSVYLGTLLAYTPELLDAYDRCAAMEAERDQWEGRFETVAKVFLESGGGGIPEAVATWIEYVRAMP